MAVIMREHAKNQIRALRELARREYNGAKLLGRTDWAEFWLAHWDHYGELLTRLG